MSPHEHRQFAINVTWTWPVVICLLVLAMIPIWGPLMPPLDGTVWPVTSKVTFVDQQPTEGWLLARMSYTKNRDCEIIGVSLDRDRLGELHELYLSCGVRRREDTVYMRSVRPDFEVNTARW